MWRSLMKIWGTVRFAPNLIQASQIREVVTQTTERTGGGKGGGHTQVTNNYAYYTTLDLLWIRDEFLDSTADFGKVVVHGHSPALEPELLPNRINVDTGEATMIGGWPADA